MRMHHHARLARPASDGPETPAMRR